MSEDLGFLASLIEKRSLYPLHLALCQPSYLVLVVDSGKEPCIEAHLSKQSRGGV